MQIVRMNESHKSEVLSMMKIFYNSPAVNTNGSDEIFLNDFENCINDNCYLEGYIFDERGIAGYAMVAKSFSTEFGKPCIWIEDIYIKEEHRGKGIGSSFIKYISEKYSDCVIRLEAEEENRNAVSVYEKSGFERLPYLEMIKNHLPQ